MTESQQAKLSLTLGNSKIAFKFAEGEIANAILHILNFYEQYREVGYGDVDDVITEILDARTQQ